MKATILLSLLVSMLVFELTEAGPKRTTIPAWVRRQMRRGRRRNGDTTPTCDDYENSRCDFGSCYLADENYADTQAGFTNALYETKFYCFCNPGYETYYEDNDTGKKDKPKEFDSWCNAEQNPCRVENANDPNVCQSESMDNSCRHTGPNQQECDCTKFWEGEICQLDVDECKPCDIGDGAGCPCKNGATCRNTKQSGDNPLGFKCYCEMGTTGQYCEKISDPCLRNPCMTKVEYGGAADENQCTPLASGEIDIAKPETLYGYKCTCQDGWGGLNCELRAGSCSSEPCGKRGLCLEDPDYPSFYQCVCNPGYKNNADKLSTGAGEFCTDIINLCDSEPCRNGATCLMIAANVFKCACTPGWNGPSCESHVNPCYSTIPGREKCFNKGVCSQTGDSGTEYTCNCDGKGYTGPLCEDDEDECIKTPSPCDSSGTEKCKNNVGGFECTCKNGYLGKTCNAIESLCTSMPNICLYGGTCQPGSSVDANFGCDCSVVKYGTPTAFAKSSSDLRCVQSSSFHRLALSELVINDANVKPDTSAVFFTRKGGILDDPFIKLNYGAFKVTSPNVILRENGWMVLYFKSPAPTSANLMTVVSPNEDNKKLFEIVASADRLSFDLKFHTSSDAITISLPRHSLKSWNTIWVLVDQASKSISAYLNTALIKTEKYRTFSEFGADQHVVFGSSVDEKGEMTAPFFNGGIADLFYGKDLAASSQVITSLKYNLGTLHNPNCPFSVLDLTMDTKDPYRDAGCMRFDPIAVVEELFSEGVTVNNQYFPLVKFGPRLKPDDSMAKYVKVRPDAEMVVPNFPFLFSEGIDAKYGMMFRFRPTWEVPTEQRTTFLYSRVRDTTNSENVIEVGAEYDTSDWWFFVKLRTTAEMKEIISPKYAQGECPECVYSFAINWDATADNGDGVDNIHISNLDQGEVKKTTFTIQGKIDAAKVSPLVFGSDQKYQIGRTRFKVGGLFSDDDITAFLTKGETPPKTN